ncbi:unnamed protein product [Periconia digitata]|uniref:Uncharacterized protein n=1 Tax=Periconia digitata TaxID=1303443 RepID=A0A9W4UCS9_9PLEO|nr:unnamed protein product [Periconia digitata]
MAPFLKKVRTATLGEKPNPYNKRNNPSNPTYNPTSVSQDPDPLSLPENTTTVSPRGSIDYLAEARQASGRDPVTGKRAIPATSSEGNQASHKPRSFMKLRHKIGASHRDANPNSNQDNSGSTDPANPFADPEPEPHAKANSGTQQQTADSNGNHNNGNVNMRYEQYIWQMRERELARQAWQEPAGGSFYAPPRRDDMTYYTWGRPQAQPSVESFFRDGKFR